MALWWVMLACCLVEVARSQSYTTKRIVMKVGEVQQIATPRYPEVSPSDLRQTWAFETDDDAVFVLNCTDIRFLEAKPCKDDMLVVANGYKVESKCGTLTNWWTVTAKNKMAVSVKTGPKVGARLNCEIKCLLKKDAPPPPSTQSDKWSFLNRDSEEFDSSEHGVSLGRKGTTCKCGWANKSGGKRIFGGVEAKVNEFPFIVGIMRRSLGMIFCGATLVTRRHAITASHCFYNKTGEFQVVVGEHDVRNAEETPEREVIDIKKIVLHEKYSPKNYVNDIALLLLSKDVKFSELVGPACLPTGFIKLDKEIITTIGWGRTPTQPFGSPVLRKVNLIVLPKEQCASFRPGFVPPGSPNQLCTYGTRKSACSGDSGGPLVWVEPETNRYTLVGIVSYGTRDCGNVMPRVSTDVSMYLDWIQDSIQANEPENTCSKA